MRGDLSVGDPRDGVQPQGLRPFAGEADLVGCNHPSYLTLRTLREHLGISLRDLERLSGIRRPLMSRVERGHELAPPMLLVRLSAIYGVSADDWTPAFEYRIQRELVELPATSKEDDHAARRDTPDLR